ncbi:MAG TPA: hypothetical protein VK213_09785 [Bacteroidales bacterium]|nr:hypothetical protein [Bacteroidales bacterium]
MITKTILSSLAFFIAGVLQAYSQIYNLPATGLKSHQTLEVTRVEITPKKTIIYVSIENRRNGGTFCADRNISVILPTGNALKLEKAVGIPRCPDVYKFKTVGEILDFTLEFPKLPAGTGYIDLIEQCQDNCFSVYGILLNDPFSRGIDNAMSYVNRGQTDSAIGMYQKLISQAGEGEKGILGSLYADLITLLSSKGYTANAAEWYRKLESSDIPSRELYLQNLNFRGIKY